jgi:transcriptional regulator with XRE-family HTH domain
MTDRELSSFSRLPAPVSLFDISNESGYLNDQTGSGRTGAMGVEGRDKQKIMESGALALTGQLGNTVQRLRKAYNLSLSELSQQSGVAKSIISQIERNETNPTLATIWRLAQALDVSIERVLQTAEDAPFLEKATRADTPILVSDDGKCRLAIIGWIKTVEWLQCYDFSADPGGVLESDAHQRGSVESLSVLDGELEVEVAGVKENVKAGETLRYRCDRPHTIRNLSKDPFLRRADFWNHALTQ